MKFSHSLQFNAVPEWSSKYIAYTTLKKLIYSLQRDSLRRSYQQDDDEANLEGSHLINDSNNYASTGQLTPGESPSNVFIAALDAELKKIDTFYQQQESFIFNNMDELMIDINNFEREVDESLSLPGSNKSFKSHQQRRIQWDLMIIISPIQILNSPNQKMMKRKMTMRILQEDIEVPKIPQALK